MTTNHDFSAQHNNRHKMGVRLLRRAKQQSNAIVIKLHDTRLLQWRKEFGNIRC